MQLLERIAAFFTSVLLIMLGLFGAGVNVKRQTPVGELTLSAADITDGLTVTLPERAGSVRFNRISFSYEATAPVRAVFAYVQGGRTLEEELLLSKTGHTATMLLDGYLDKKVAACLVSVRFEPIVPGTDCTLSVSDFTCEVQAVPKDDVLYIENDFYKVGVKLNWGGGLCCFIDKRDSRYDNLLNCHDTGRLVQQSYYGPTKIEGYENGVFGDSVWCYNPVQGGDQYGNTSKLVAVEAAADRIRVVSRPLDWAKDNLPTQTYYTNEYLLTDRGLTVTNTAVDFLTTPWSDRDQEIPAFYTLSALGNFVFYDGDAPWTDAPLRVEKELGFWAGKPAFTVRAGNTENWCAWTDNTGYGVGLYTPIATKLLAGRYLYNGTADADADPTNYVAPLGVFRLTFGEPFTYTYHLTAGTVDEIRQTFKELR